MAEDMVSPIDEVSDAGIEEVDSNMDRDTPQKIF